MIIRARYVDTFNTNSAHEMFNASLLLMCCMIFKEVDCKTSRSNFAAITKLIPNPKPANIHYKPIATINSQNRLVLLWRYIVGALKNVWQIIITPKDQLLILPFNNLFAVRIINAINKICRKKIVIFCHGELEGLSPDAIKAGLLSKLLIKLSRNFFLNKNIKLSKTLYFSVLGDVIAKNLSDILPPQFTDHFICIDHPYIFDIDDENPVYARTIHFPIHLGTVGGMNQTKGLNSYIDLVKNMPKNIRDKFEFSITGRVIEDATDIKALGIDVPDNHANLPREKFDQRVKNLDFILFFYPQKSYKITASGAIMDAIYHKKAIFSLHNDYFEYMFNKFGRFGRLCNSIDELATELAKITQQETLPHYDFSSIARNLTPKAISTQMISELKRIEVI